MTPIERIRRNREMADLAREKAKPKAPAAPFPRNSSALAILMFAVSPLLYKAIETPTVQNVLGYGVITLIFGLGLFLLALGKKHSAIYTNASVAGASDLPLKSLGSGALALASAGLVVFDGGGAALATATAIAVAVFSVVAFGLDPRQTKGLDTQEDRDLHHLETLAAKVGAKMEEVHKSVSHLAVPQVTTQVRAFDTAVNNLLSAVTDDPSRTGGLRKYFGVYLDGAANASKKFAAVYRGTGCETTKAEYLAFMTKLTRAYIQKARDYAEEGSTALEIELDVMDDYLTGERAAAG